MGVQVEDRLLARGEPEGDHRLVEGGEKGALALVLMGEPVGVVRERGLLRQDRAMPASSEAAGSASRSSTWDTRLVEVSFKPSSDKSQLVAGITPVLG